MRISDWSSDVCSSDLAAALANAAIGAAAGAFIAPMLGTDGRLLFLALALIFLAAGMFWPTKQPDPLANWRLGPFLTSALGLRSEEHTSELQSLMRISYAVFCLKKKKS